jgi:amino acid adenylation domain-containing protein/non-ribosomal peptide synthase protein (TIGR01720 family)
MTTRELLSQLLKLNIKLWLDGERLRYSAPQGVMNPELQAELAKHKAEIIVLLQGSTNLGDLDSPLTVPAERPEQIPLSFAQQRLWFIDQLEPGNAAYNMFNAVRLRGALDVAALERGFNQVVQRHESLRTTFAAKDGQPFQVIAPSLEISLPVVDITTLSGAEQETEVQRLAREEAQRPFDLSKGPLVRCSLLRLSDNPATGASHVLLLTMHHIVSDGWSMGVLFRETILLAQAYAAGQDDPLPALPLQYADFAVWQREWLQGEVLERQISYWKKQLADAPAALELPTDHPRPALQTYRGARIQVALSRELSDALQELSRQEDVTLFMTLLAAFQVLLSRYSRQTDIVVGSPVANRSRAELEGLIGCFVNDLVLRTDLSDNPSFREALKRAREACLGAYDHQDVPFEKLVDELRVARDLSRNPLFQVMFILQNAPMILPDLSGLSVEALDIEPDTAQFDLRLSLQETPAGITGILEYNTDLFERQTIVRMFEHFQQLLLGVVANPGQRLSDLPLLTESEQQQILVKWNATQAAYPQDKCIHELFEAQVKKTPDSVALVFDPNTPGAGDRHLTYRELNQRANQLAHYLRSQGMGPDELVGICVERSLEMVVGLLGVLKAGGAYVPLDPTFPKERLAFMLADSRLPVLLTQERLVADLPEHQARVIRLDADWPDIAKEKTSNPALVGNRDQLAYVIYTSGSTGRPKGVQVVQGALVNFLTSMRREPAITPEDRLLSVTTLSFDIAGLELYLPLIVGAQVEVISREMAADGFRLSERLKSSGATVMQATPATWRLLLDAGWDETGQVKALCGGETLAPELAGALLPRATSLWNLYGPTETTIWSTLARMESAGGIAPIGRPIANTQVYVLDEHLNPTPVGVPGELYIGGDGLARGYLNRPDLTAEKFVPNPFVAGGCRLYKTGDLARWQPSGNLEYLGRIDFQVKVHGFRIELGEIESALSQHPDVRQTVVVACEDHPGDKRLVAYIVPRASAELPVGELRSALKTRLPDYMLPNAFVFLDQLPLTPNGKIDRKALPSPEPGAGLATAYVAPRSELEQIISQVWAETLQVEKVGVNDNFFELGGHSLLVTRIHSHLRERLKRDLKMVTLFQYPTVSALAGYLSVTGADEEPAAHSGSLRAQLRRDLMKQPDEGIAVIGLVGRFPDAQDTGAFWQNLCAGKESVTFFSEAELRAAGVDDELLSNPNYVKARPVLENIEEFDPFFFGYSPREAALMDPQQRFFLESAWEALEQAGYDSERYAGRIGVYASVSANSYLLNNLLPAPGLVQSLGIFQTMLGNDKDFVTTRVSYKLNLKGPSFNVQTACSSSLVALHLACQSLLMGESDMALAGGVSISSNQKTGYIYQEGGIASPDGHCRAFDAQAKGTLFGNGVGVVVLKRLSEALADGDMICAVIKGMAINNDGSLKVGYTAPSVDGQAQAIAEAQAMAGVKPETIGYVETHGTGTELGDPIEIAALTQAFGRTQQTGFCAIGSVKTNIGHLDAAAGVAGLLKTVLALQHQAIPPSLHFEQANPAIDFEHSPFYVNAKLAEWPLGPTPRRAGVSSFGIGGTNVHAVLEEAPLVEPSGPSRPWQLLLLSAKTGTALEKATTNLAEHLKMHPDANPSTGFRQAQPTSSGHVLADAAYTLQVGRHIFDQRRAVVCRDVDDAIAALESLDPKRVSTGIQQQKEQAVAFMFTGQGAQYVGMGSELYILEPVFREQVDLCCELLQPHLGLDLRSVLYPADQAEAAEQLGQTWLTQPALFVIEYALAQLWMSWGVQPKALIGHSIGEYVAACLAGVFSLEDALALVAARGRLMQSLPGGAMLAVPLAEAEVQALLGDTLSLAAVNGPALCVVSGNSEAVDALEGQLKEKGVECQRLHTSHAFHSAMMDPILDAFAAEVRQVKRNPPQIPFVSNLTGEWISAAEATDPAYWARHLRNTVRFGDGLEQLLKDPAPLLLEIGPGRTLSSLALQHPGRTAGQTVLSSLRHAQDTQSDQAFLLAALGKLWLAGVAVDWAAFYQGERRCRVPLPTYPFERQRCWIEPQSGKQPGIWAADGTTSIADWFYVPLWKYSALTATEDDSSLLSPCLVFADQCGLGSQLAASLAQNGRQVVIVQAGVSFAKLDDQHYVLNPGQAEDYVALFDDLLARGKFPQVIAHMWNVTQERRAELGVKKTVMAQETGFYSLLFLAQALGLQDTPIRLVVVSNGLQKVTGEEENISLGKTTLLGPVRIIPSEYAHIRCRSIDVDLAQPQPELVDLLMAELVSESSDMIVAYRDLCRWVQTFEPIRLGETGENAPRLKSRGVYLITGGLGGIGFILARHIAQAVQARLVLVGRSALPPVEEWDQWLATHDEDDNTSRRIRQIRELETLGAEVLFCAADVANAKQMRSAMVQALQRFGRLNGVIHSAGVLGGGIIQLKTREMAEKVFAPKVKGTLVLAELLKDQRLDFVILCSSLSSVVSVLGQVDYCAANGFMDAFSHSRYLPGTPVISVNWNTWNEVGMAIEAREQELGMQDDPANGLNSREGVEAFNRILAHRLPQVFISKGDLAARVVQSQAWNAGLISDIAGRAVSPGTLHPRPQLKNPYMAPESEIEQTLASIWQELLGIEQVGIRDNFFELGGDSLLALRIISKARQAGLHFAPKQFFQSPTVAGLAEAVGLAATDLETVQEIITGLVPLDPPQTWFFRTFKINPGRFSIAVCVEAERPLDRDLLLQTLQHLLAHHDMLRARFVATQQGWQQTIVAPDEVSPCLSVYDFSALPAERHNESTLRLALELQDSFNLSAPPLIKAAYLNLGSQLPARVLIGVHHLVTDGFSMDVILKDIQSIYMQLSVGQPVSLPPKTTAFKTYTENILHYARTIAMRELDYWLHLPWEQVKPLPMDRPENRMQDTYAHMQFAPMELGVADTQALLHVIKAQASAHVQMTEFLLAALALAFKQWRDIDVLWITFSVTGRSAPLDQLDLSRTVGWIGTTAHYLLDIGNVDPAAALNVIGQQISATPGAGLGYELLTYLVDDPESAEEVEPVLVVPKTHALFNYVGDMFSSTQDQLLALRPVPGLSIQGATMREWNDQRFHPLQIDGMIGENGLVLRFFYGPVVFHQATIEALAALYRQSLLALIEDCQA